MALAEAAIFYNSFEAGMASARLEAEGIPSVLFDLNSSMEGASFLIPIRLMVDDEDVGEARRILAQLGEPGSA
jgi:hypothetical protein